MLDKRIFSTEHHRLPKGVQFNGQGKLDVEAYLLQDEPVAAFKGFMEAIRAAGGEPVVHPGVLETLERKIRRHKMDVMALKHTIYTKGASSMASIIGLAKRALGSWWRP